jgi:hypothetical protein
MRAFAIGLYSMGDTSCRPVYREVVDKLVAKHEGRCRANDEPVGSLKAPLPTSPTSLWSNSRRWNTRAPGTTIPTTHR